MEVKTYFSMKKIKTTRKCLANLIKKEGWQIVDFTLGSKGLIYEIRNLDLNEQCLVQLID